MVRNHPLTEWQEFIDCQRGILIAPAGHGKTTAIADCLLQCPENSCQLVLTHTNAGLASLRKKFIAKNVPPRMYQLETITGFARRYVIHFLGASELPDEESDSYFDVAVEECRHVVRSDIVQIIIKATYNGVFVDEYQDCSIDQHNMIMELARDLPLRLMGDPLQAIFSFEGKPLVDFEQDLSGFKRFNLLEYPWRWETSNRLLGQEILNIRHQLEAGQTVELRNNPKASFFVMPYFRSDEDKFKYLGRFLQSTDCNSLLIIYPSYREIDRRGHRRFRGDLEDRVKLKQRIDYSDSLTIVDAIDSSEYYNLSKKIDSYVTDHIHGQVAGLYNILEGLHTNKTELDKWISRERNIFIHKKEENAVRASELASLFTAFESVPTLSNLRKVIDFVLNLPGIKVYHQNVCDSVRKCFDMAQTNDISMYEAMKLLKSRVRHQGRRIEGKCIGTTLLTKGLEFDTVIIFNANKFEDAKNFYVAISRACKELIIITDKTTLEFKDKPAPTQHEHVYQPTLF